MLRRSPGCRVLADIVQAQLDGDGDDDHDDHDDDDDGPAAAAAAAPQYPQWLLSEWVEGFQQSECDLPKVQRTHSNRFAMWYGVPI